MATVPSASPRPSLSLMRSPPSSRTSLDHASNPSAPPSLSRASVSGPPRRARVALRDYYGLKSGAADGSRGSVDTTASRVGGSIGGGSRLDALDREGFDAGAYVRQVLETERLEGLLSLENELVGEVRTLDGERKALVYDNYSKLISATDTIKKMRSNMDPLAPATSTLAPAIAHIAETAASLSSELDKGAVEGLTTGQKKQQRQRLLIQRAVDCPTTLTSLIDEGHNDEAIEEWATVQKILDRCQAVAGIAELRERCQKIIDSIDSD
ncbi:hypothetical protein BT63DRAFT_78953 [Microthyrium microscopicum]|uniref:Vacuolar protein sorting-associated protein 51 homolog n=1 Tax=Microthyrium microscopicum TaxID=703497 RepID=A0A6A6U0X0_9PEZI|nr:hypothetical protein BT63DRAFT_78953 [Microthyrium microscopicum]